MNKLPADLRALRLSYASAIAATVEAEQLRSQGGSRRTLAASIATVGLITRERAAGRAYMAALDEQDPACSVCGCTQFDPCDEGCWWAQLPPAGPPVCSSCVSNA